MRQMDADSEDEEDLVGKYLEEEREMGLILEGDGGEEDDFWEEMREGREIMAGGDGSG